MNSKYIIYIHIGAQEYAKKDKIYSRQQFTKYFLYKMLFCQKLTGFIMWNVLQKVSSKNANQKNCVFG